jgi:hypothetical protein
MRCGALGRAYIRSMYARRFGKASISLSCSNHGTQDTSRTHEHLTPNEIERLIAAAHQAGGRVAERDAPLIMMA